MNERQKKTRIPFQHSIKMKIVVLIVISIIATVGFVMIENISIIKSDLTRLTQNYMKDMAVVSGKNIDGSLLYTDAESILSTEQLKSKVEDICVAGLESSYTYVVAADSTMLYHPTAEKIGQPVENEVVKQLIGEMEKGKRPEADVISYPFNGVTKYASYYVGQNMEYIIVVTADEAEVFSDINKIVMLNVVGGIVALVLFGVFGYVMACRIVKPIEKVTEDIEKLAHLDFTPSNQSDDLARQKSETGVMTRAVVQLQKKLTEEISNMKQQSRKLFEITEDVRTQTTETKQTIEQVDKAIGELAEGATTQARETQTANENIILMGNMIEETKDEVGVLRENAKDMQISGEQALQILEELSAINQKTKSAINIISDQTIQTNQSAMEIQRAIDIITDIAEETNLLSLNASIEAARAGEQGRGFAVVASQIQKLAEQSSESATQIENIIKLLISDSKKTVTTMKEVNDVVEKQDEDVRKTAESFDRVKKGIATSIASVNNIAQKSEQLNEARVKVVDVVQSLTAIAEENAASTEQTSASATAVGEIMASIANSTDQLNEAVNGIEDSVKLFIIE